MVGKISIELLDTLNFIFTELTKQRVRKYLMVGRETSIKAFLRFQLHNSKLKVKKKQFN
jgi:hypothetical protein